jgi:GNAT superfamily N-acetyltransferase
VASGGEEAGGTFSPTRFLLDTNAFIALEPFAGHMEAGMGPAATFMRLAMKQRHHIFIHPATRDDLAEDKDGVRLKQSMAELGKFDTLAESPIHSYIDDELGPVEPDTNDHRDRRILASLYANSVNFLVSDDGRLRKRATRIGVGARVLTLADAVAMLEGFEPTALPPPPRVANVPSYALDLEQDIFVSIRGDYEDFDQWTSKVQGDSTNRECFVVQEDDGTYAAIAIVKVREDDCEYDFTQPVSKISTFKVAEQYSGSRYGELLLKAVLQSHHDHRIGSAYVEVWDRHQPLIDFLGQFGYVEAGQSPKGEVALVKTFQPRDGSLSPLEYHIRYGPPAVSAAASAFVIPIRNHWHNQLFPECAMSGPKGQLVFPDLAGEKIRPWGNALRKAYLCNASTERIEPGDVILFYRSGGFKSVEVVGVAEETHRTSSAQDVVNMVGGRTVYSAEDIELLARHPSQVLVVLFRRDWVIDPPWTLGELQANNVLKAPPQTVQQVKEAGTQWIHRQLADR